MYVYNAPKYSREKKQKTTATGCKSSNNGFFFSTSFKGRCGGVTIGCLLGMLPLLFMNTNKDKDNKDKDKENDTETKKE